MTEFINGGREALPTGRTFPAACCRVLQLEFILVINTDVRYDLSCFT